MVKVVLVLISLVAASQAMLPSSQGSGSFSDLARQEHARFLETMRNGFQPPPRGHHGQWAVHRLSEGQQLYRTINGNQVTERREHFRSDCRQDGECSPTSRTFANPEYEPPSHNHGHGYCTGRSCDTSTQPAHIRPQHPQGCSGAHCHANSYGARNVSPRHRHPQCTGHTCHSGNRAMHAYPQRQHHCTGGHCQAVTSNGSDDDWADSLDYDSGSDSEHVSSDEEYADDRVTYGHIHM